ncbi:cysteine-rich and transmembrane domain-containing protein A [Panicum miliaceum]|uniref:Cysteine-rich and transmembrane domain-containing protein A n=1 Tax=Panicum miliaceum TaxID=4540 RepID=A0A3L6T3R4_PANMI|nr:cysteine-rich and transmembrane domain-containing protein A [Panicum miliaceum]
MEGVNHKNLQPPLGYPTVDSAQQGAAASPRGRRAIGRGRKTSFIDGCIAALCCCWLCDLCCD